MRKRYQMRKEQQEKDWLVKLYKFMKERGTPINSRLAVSGKRVNLYQLYKLVKEEGGYDKIIKIKEWRSIAKCLGISPIHGTVPGIKKLYYQNLLPFERFYNSIGKSCKESVPSDTNRISTYSSNDSLPVAGPSRRIIKSNVVKIICNHISETSNIPQKQESYTVKKQQDSLSKEINYQTRSNFSLQLDKSHGKTFHQREGRDLGSSDSKQVGKQDMCNVCVDMNSFSNYTSCNGGNHLCLPTEHGSNSNSFNHQLCSYQLPTLATANKTFPVYQNVRFKKLPFYDVIGELLRPSSLVLLGNKKWQENVFMFHLTPEQATSIANTRNIVNVEYPFQVQLRLGILNLFGEQRDFFPPGLSVKVNEEACPLPLHFPNNITGKEPRHPSQPLDITSLVKLSPDTANHVAIKWNARSGHDYVVSIQLVCRLKSSDLLERLKSRGIRHPEFTRNQIKEKFYYDSFTEINTTDFRFPLTCPLGKMRINVPCCSTSCSHLQCFDGYVYLKMNENKPMWKCPICYKLALYDDLIIDGYFQEVLSSEELPEDATEIQLQPDGTWSPASVQKELIITKPARPHVKAEVNSVGSSDILIEGYDFSRVKPKQEAISDLEEYNLSLSSIHETSVQPTTKSVLLS